MDDLERFYGRVDDYGWYQGMFETRIREVYSKLGLNFLREVRRDFPRGDSSPAPENRLENRTTIAQTLERLERIAPGFQKWAEGFRPGERSAAK